MFLDRHVCFKLNMTFYSCVLSLIFNNKRLWVCSSEPANRADLSHENLYFNNITFCLALWQAFTLLKAAMPFNFSSPEFLSHSKLRKNQVSPVHMNSLIFLNENMSTACITD